MSKFAIIIPNITWYKFEHYTNNTIFFISLRMLTSVFFLLNAQIFTVLYDYK